MIEMERCLKSVKNLKLLARDEISLGIIKDNMKISNAELYPDIVTTLIGQNKYDNERNGICMCVRNDGEKYYSDKEINNLLVKLKEISQDVDITDTNCKNLSEFDIKTIEGAVYEKIKSFSKYKVIITDRFHGTIFSLVAGTPVIVIKTNDHKVSSGVNWFKDIYHDYIYYADSIECVPDIVMNILSNNSLTHELNTYFKKEYYDKLTI